MHHSHLTLKYRPQSFSEVLGQEAVCRILSRAAAEDAVAPAYLFSGTRGVGKTTMARILAKAINCTTAPTAEPCNQCDNCRQVTRGSSIDVVEIDGASNTGVEHVRRLKEDVGYAPIEFRYKVIIIDEAHMLSKAAFNALLKTLEEPPGHVTFIMATTEAQRFPATIISRCQHYVFKRLAQPLLEKHLASILDSEDISYDQAAVSLLARRGAGSVRDSLSLMTQVVALGADTLSEEDVRQVLGLTGHESLFELFAALENRDCRAINGLLRRILDQGLDLGFFLRELTMAWRNLFLLRQTGRDGLDMLEVTEADADRWMQWSERFSAAHIHACWQLTLEGQRRVLTSVEPALALELLLLNLAFLPDLLPVQSLGGARETPPESGGNRKPASSPGPRHHASTGSAAPAGRHQDTAAAAKVAPQAPAGGSDADGPGFLRFSQDKCSDTGTHLPLKRLKAVVDGSVLGITCASQVQGDRLRDRDKFDRMRSLAAEYFGREMTIEIKVDESAEQASMAEIKNRAFDHPLVKEAREEFNAQVTVRPHGRRS